MNTIMNSMKYNQSGEYKLTNRLIYANSESGKEGKKVISLAERRNLPSKNLMESIANKGGEGKKLIDQIKNQKLKLNYEDLRYLYENLFAVGNEKTKAGGQNPYAKLTQSIANKCFGSGDKFQRGLVEDLVDSLNSGGESAAEAGKIINEIHLSNAGFTDGQKTIYETRLKKTGVLEAKPKGNKVKETDQGESIVAIKRESASTEGEIQKVNEETALEMQKEFPLYKPKKIPEIAEKLFEKIIKTEVEAFNKLDEEIYDKENEIELLEQTLKKQEAKGKKADYNLISSLRVQIEYQENLFKELKKEWVIAQDKADQAIQEWNNQYGHLKTQEAKRREFLEAIGKMWGLRDIKESANFIVPGPKGSEKIEISEFRFEAEEGAEKDDPGVFRFDYNLTGADGKVQRVEGATQNSFYNDYIVKLGAYEDISIFDLNMETDNKIREGNKFFYLNEYNAVESIRIEKIFQRDGETIIKAKGLSTNDGRIKVMPASAYSKVHKSANDIDDEYQENGEFTPGQFLQYLKRFNCGSYQDSSYESTMPNPAPYETINFIWDGRPACAQGYTSDKEGRDMVLLTLPGGLQRRFPRVMATPNRENSLMPTAPTKIPRENLETLTREKFGPQYRKKDATGPSHQKYSSKEDLLTPGIRTTEDELTDETAPAGMSNLTDTTTTDGPTPSTAELPKRSPIYNEALPYSEVDKTGGMQWPQKNFIKEFWRQTRVLSLSDIWNLGKTAYEFHDRKFKRKQQGRFSDVAKDVTYFSPEMKRIAQQAENEQVNQYKESIDQWGIWQIEKQAFSTNDRDELKACLIVLSSKGQLRLDDVRLWQALNRFADGGHYIPIPFDGDPSRTLDKQGRTGMHYVERTIDSFWGEGQYSSWFTENKSAYRSGVQKYYERGKESENKAGGPGKRLAELLFKHKHNEFIDPQEYEGLIEYMISAGKGDGEEKFYYLVEGLAAKNDDGRTIMSWDRISHLNAEMTAKFPFLDYLASSSPGVNRPDGVAGTKWTVEDFSRWQKDFDQDDPNNCKPNDRVSRFIWKNVVPSHQNITRVNKDVRNAENLDHDDAHLIIPVLSSALARNICQTVGGGGKELMTKEGYMNAYAGYSEYFKNLAEQNDLSKLKTAIQSYVSYDSILTNRYKRGQSGYARIDDDLMRKKMVVSDYTVSDYRSMLNPTIQNILQRYIQEMPKGTQKDNLQRFVQLYARSTDEWADMPVQQEKAESEELTRMIDNFDSMFSRVIQSDNGAKMHAVVSGTDLFRYGYLSPEEKAHQKTQLAAMR